MYASAVSCRLRPIRRALLALALGAAIAVAPHAATAAHPEDAAVESWVGRYCTPLGCRGAGDSALANAIGFATAAAAILLIRRRRA